jgi:hypothetical protein
MGKTLSDEDIDAIATRVVQIIGTRFSAADRWENYDVGGLPAAFNLAWASH